MTDPTPPSPTTEPGPGPADPGPGSVPPLRTLTRRRDDRVLGGVASGIARYFGIDPVLVRVAFVVAAVLAGVGVLAYVAGWLLIPEERDGEIVPAPRRRADIRQIAGCVVLGIGLLIAIGRVGFWVDERVVWAAGLILVGGAVLWLRGRDARATTDDELVRSATAPPPPPRAHAPRPAAFESTWSAPTVPARPWRAGAVPPTPGAPSAPWAMPRPLPSTPRERRPPSKLGLLAISLVLIGSGVAIALDAAEAIDLSAVALLGGAIVLLGGALVVGGWWGRARWLVAPAVLLALVAGSVSALDVPLGGGIGERDYRPRTVAAIEDEYELGIGSLELDLRRPDYAGRTTAVKATLGIGEMKVFVPDDVRLVIDEHLQAGDLDNFGDHDSGGDVDQRVLRRGLEGAGTLRLDLRGGVGSIRVLGSR